MTDWTRTYGGVTSYSVKDSKAGVRIGIYGPGGIGKTTLACTIADSDLGWPVYYLNARGNPEVARSYGDKIQVVDIESFGQVEQIRKGMVADYDRPFKSVIIDNLSELHSMSLRDRYGADAEIKWQMHSASTAEILQLARNWSDLATIQGMNVIFIAWETPEERSIRGQDATRSEMAFNKALQSQLPGIISWLGRLYIVEDEHPYTRCLDFRPIETMHQAKFQVDPNEPYVGEIPMEIYNPSLASILDTVKGGKPFPVEKHKKAETELERLFREQQERNNKK